jgi:hypothetical protein
MKKSLHFYYWLIIFIITLSIFSCNNNDWILFRVSNDYFPLTNGNWWKYETNGMNELVKVISDTNAYGISCSYLTRNFADEFWTKENSEVKKLVVRTMNFGGTDYTIQEVWTVQYHLPFVLGNYWSNTYRDTATVLGDTYYTSQAITRKVVAVEDINVPAGSFLQTYKLEYMETIAINDSSEQYSGFEWYSPGLGLVKSIINNTTKELIDYSVK